jgi:uncharacterized membrane protein
VEFREVCEWVVKFAEAFGVIILMIGSLLSLNVYVRAIFAGRRIAAYTQFRNNLGRVILLGLEVFIIADIIRTVTIEPTIETAVLLGTIVLVRTFLSFSLEIELEGVLPWKRAEFLRSMARDGQSPPADPLAPGQPGSSSLS